MEIDITGSSPAFWAQELASLPATAVSEHHQQQHISAPAPASTSLHLYPASEQTSSSPSMPMDSNSNSNSTDEFCLEDWVNLHDGISVSVDSSLPAVAKDVDEDGRVEDISGSEAGHEKIARKRKRSASSSSLEVALMLGSVRLSFLLVHFFISSNCLAFQFSRLSYRAY
jgi:hypothetical protein